MRVGGGLATLSDISRVGWKSAGTRFPRREIDAAGNVGHFDEVGSLASQLRPVDLGRETRYLSFTFQSVSTEQALCSRILSSLAVDLDLPQAGLAPRNGSSVEAAHRLLFPKVHHQSLI